MADATPTAKLWASPAKPPAPAATAAKPMAPSATCSHCFGAKFIDHHGKTPCPWCSGGTARKGS